MSEWISVKDRLPEKDTTVLICTRGGEVWMAEYRNECRACFIPPFPISQFWETVGAYDGCGIEFETEGVTHWMELPEPPEGEEENGD